VSTQATGSVASALAWAEAAHALVQADPRRARTLAERALAAASAGHDVEAEIAARHALGWALHSLGDAAEGRRTLSAGIRLAEEHGALHRAGVLRRHLAYQLATDGAVSAARRELVDAIALLSGPEVARSQVHRLEIHRLGRAVDPGLDREVLARAARAMRSLRRRGDALWEARLLQNRGALYFDRGDLGRADADWRRAQELYAAADARAQEADVAVLLAVVALLEGDTVSCLRTLDAVERSLPAGAWLFQLDHCRVTALAQARLLPEARAAGEAHLARCAETGRGEWAMDTLLTLADVAVGSGDATRAAELAARAVRSFAARRQPVGAALAQTQALRARALDGSASPPALRAGLTAAAALETAGWRRDALRARLAVARAAISAGSRRVARRELALAAPLARSGTTIDRIELCHARALLALADGRPTAAKRLLRSGLRLLEEYRSAFGAPELRANASGLGEELARDGLRMALAGGHTKDVLSWSERLRANGMRLPAVRPPADARLRALQTELRRTEAELREATTTGKRPARAAARRSRLEGAIRTRARLLAGFGDARAQELDLRVTKQLLGDRALVEYARIDGSLHALTLANGRLELHELDASRVDDELEWLRFGLTRLARGGSRDSVDAGAQALEDLLLAPLLPSLGGAPLVVVPTGALHGLPWATLPSLRGRPIVVAPSAANWTELAARRRSRARRTAFVAGPRLRHAAAEARAVAALHTHAVVLDGAAATAAATLAAIDGAALAHIACHGRFRSDNPLFSSLELADGPLTVYELQRLRRAPHVFVLAACDLALSGHLAGDELLGLAAALLGMGTRTIVASVVPVPDSVGKRLMLDFHRNLAARGAAAALAAAQARAAFAGFVCLGSG
jgi:CHAT domain